MARREEAMGAAGVRDLRDAGEWSLNRADAGCVGWRVSTSVIGVCDRRASRFLPVVMVQVLGGRVNRRKGTEKASMIDVEDGGRRTGAGRRIIWVGKLVGDATTNKRAGWERVRGVGGCD